MFFDAPRRINPRREHARYRWTNRLLVALAVAYLVMAMVRERNPGGEEFYPFSSWSLFSKIPNETRDYTIRILAIDGRVTEPPVDFEEAQAMIGWPAKSHEARRCIQDLGEAVERGDAAQADHVRSYFEPLYLSGRGQIRYAVVARRYDPLERWREGRLQEVRVLREFQSESPESR